MDAFGSKCRACLTMDPLQLFDWNVDLLENLTYLDCFRQCTHLEVLVDEPKMLCYNCASELKCVYNFLQKTRQSDRVLRLNKSLIHTTEDSLLDESGLECVSTDAKNLSSSPHHMSNESNDVGDNWLDSTNSEATTTDDSDSWSLLSERILPKVKCKKKQQAKDTSFSSTKKARCRGRSKTEESDQQQSDQIDSKTFSEEKKVKQQIPATEKLHLCHYCPRTFKNYSNLRIHTITHDENRERNYACDQCGRKFFYQTHMKAHMKTHDPNREPEFKCDQCEKSFTTRGSLNFHRKKHTSTTTLECPICHKGFFRTSHLEIHQQTHSGDTPYKCPYCYKAFSQKTSLLAHCMIHTGMPLKCAICGKGFAKKNKMRRHIGNVHKVEDIAERDKLTIKVKTEKINI